MIDFIGYLVYFNVYTHSYFMMYVQSSDEEKGPVLVIHQPLFHFSPAK